MLKNRRFSKKILLAVVLLLTFVFCPILSATADSYTVEGKTVTICSYLAHSAIYQAEKPAAVWGTAENGTKITAQLYQGTNKIAESEATAAGGVWELTLPGQKAGYTEYTVTILANGKKVVSCGGILFGEVWLTSGQSNMALRLDDSYEGAGLMAKANDKYLRAFLGDLHPGGANGVATPAEDLKGIWLMGNKGAQLAPLSAVAYSFGVTLRSKLDVPVAIVETSRGATNIQSWLSKEMVDSRPQLRAEMQAAGIYKETPKAYTDLGSMYNSKIAPLTRLSIAGLAWYQGESNATISQMYAEQLDLLKEKWGEQFGFPNDTMPMVYTQLAPYTSASAKNQLFMTGMMDAMTECYRKNQATAAMVTIYDLSLRYNDAITQNKAVIHPTVKQPVGQRMGLAALGLVYGQEKANAPVMKECKITNGVAKVTFEQVGSGLKVCNNSKGVLGFALSSDGVVWVNASADILDKNTVQVYSYLLKNAKYVSYAYNDMNTDANLVASNGIPAAPFTTGTDKNSGLGSRAYLNCDEDDFVVTGFSTVGRETGQASYKKLWTLFNRAAAQYDTQTRVQGIGSVKVSYKEGTVDTIFGMDLKQASKYSLTVGLKDIKTFSARMKNGDARSKNVRLCIMTTDGTKAFTSPKTLSANANFEMLVFDLRKLYTENGATLDNADLLLEKTVNLMFYMTDPQAGTVWVDDLKMGVDDYWKPNIVATADNQPPKNPTDKPSDSSSNNSSNSSTVTPSTPSEDTSSDSSGEDIKDSFAEQSQPQSSEQGTDDHSQQPDGEGKQGNLLKIILPVAAAVLALAAVGAILLIKKKKK